MMHSIYKLHMQNFHFFLVQNSDNPAFTSHCSDNDHSLLSLVQRENVCV